MEKHESTRHPEHVSGVEHQVVIQIIPKDRLPFYLEAALVTGFKVAKIAAEGEGFLHWSGENGEKLSESGQGDSAPPDFNVPHITVQKGHVVVSIERPEGIKGYAPFWMQLESLEQEKT